MAILMLYDRDNTHPDPVKDLRGCYKKGYVVEVFDDDKPLVLPPQPPFVFVKITGLTKEQVQKYTAQEADNTNPENPVITRRRAYKVLWENLPTLVKNKLQTDRYVEVTFNQVRNYIKNLKTGATE